MKLLYITPHLSTGGLPQYLLKKIEELKFVYDIYLVEYSCISYHYTVQRNKILNLLGGKFYTLNDDKNVLLEIINSIRPDIIHLEEFPETFMEDSITSKIYNENRNYKIVETTHGSRFFPLSKRFFPDKFAFVSELNINQFKELNIPYELVEYPIESHVRPNREEALKNIGLDPTVKHVLNVGLFTPGKNQAEIFEYAKYLVGTNIMFHFIGNQAENFEDYWGPLMSNRPLNCFIWGEQDNLERFYSAMDLFLFTSKWENNPLVIKEALSWQMPVLMHKLPEYGTKYDNNKLVRYLGKDNLQNVRYIQELIKSEPTAIKIPSGKKAFTINFKAEETKLYFNYLNDDIFDSIIVIKELHSNLSMYKFEAKFEKGIQFWAAPYVGLSGKLTDYPNFEGFKIEFYNKNMELKFTETLHLNNYVSDGPVYEYVPNDEIGTYVNYAEFFVKDLYKDLFPNIKLDTVVDVGGNYGIWTDWILRKGAKKVYCLEPNRKCFESLEKHFSNTPKVKLIDKGLYNKDGDITFHIKSGVSVTGSIAFPPENGIPVTIETLTLETLMTQNNINEIDLLKMDIEGAEYEIFKDIKIETLKKIKNLLLEWHYSTTGGGNRLKEIILPKLETAGFNITFRNQNTGGIGDSNLEGGVLAATQNNKPKIKAIHLLTRPTDRRELDSIKHISKLEDYGIEYIPIVNTPYSGEVPKESCIVPELVGERFNEGHYGCYLAHKDALTTGWSDEDALLIFECDAKFSLPIDEVIKKIYEAYDIAVREDIIIFSFGSHHDFIKDKKDDHYVINQIIGAHAYLVPKKFKDVFIERFQNRPWHVADLWFCEYLKDFKIGSFSDAISTQAAGVSLLDHIYQEERV